MIVLRLTGQKAVSARLAKLQKTHPAAFGKALNSVGEDILREAKQIVPLDTNRLSESGEVVQVRGAGGIIRSIIIRFGFGKDVEYAAAMHEGWRTDPRTGKKIQLKPKNGRQIKYLEKPFMEAVGTMAITVARRMKRFMEGV